MYYFNTQPTIVVKPFMKTNEKIHIQVNKYDLFISFLSE